MTAWRKLPSLEPTNMLFETGRFFFVNQDFFMLNRKGLLEG